MELSTTWKTFFKIFRQPLYAAISLAVTVSALLVIIWWQNWQLILFVFLQPENTFFMKLHFMWSLLGGIVTNFSSVSATVTVIIAFLFGIQLALLIAFVRKVKKGSKGVFHSNSFSVLGMVSGLFGIGCAACGSLIAAALLSSIGAGWLLMYLPLHGSEFGLLGICLLSYSILLLLRKLKNPFICLP